MGLRHSRTVQENQAALGDQGAGGGTPRLRKLDPSGGILEMWMGPRQAFVEVEDGKKVLKVDLDI